MSAGDLAMPTHTLWQQLSRLRREFLLVAACAGLINLLMLAPTLYMLQVFDRVMTSRNMDTLVALSAFTVVLIGLMAFTEWLRARLLVTMSERMDAGLAQPVFQASFDMKRRRADHDGLQPLHDLLQVRQFVTGSGTLALVDAPWVVIYLAALYLMHPVLGAAGAGFCLMLVALSWLTYRWTAGPQAAAGSAKAAAQRMLSSRLPVAETIIALGMLRPMADRWMRVHQEAAAQSDAALRAAQEMQALSRFVQYTQQALILSVGAILAVQGQVTIGAVIAANALLSNALRPVGVLTSAWRPLVDAWAAHGRLKTLLDQPAAANGAPQPPPADGAAEVRGLVARAPATGKEILKGIDLRIAPGEIVAVVGPSGAGKSTLGRCLVGIWRDRDGDILRGGVPLQALDLEVLGKHLGYLPQDGQLFDGTVAENIARLDNVEPGQVVEAARLVGAHDTILSLPLGYDTPLVAGGANLSGGQRQCVALARAFHGRPNLLVLDEPSSNLDDRGERMLCAALAHARSAGAAVVVITHSSQLTAIADRVVTLRDGVVTQIVHQKSPEATA